MNRFASFPGMLIRHGQYALLIRMNPFMMLFQCYIKRRKEKLVSKHRIKYWRKVGLSLFQPPAQKYDPFTASLSAPELPFLHHTHVPVT